MVLLAVTLSDL